MKLLIALGAAKKVHLSSLSVKVGNPIVRVRQGIKYHGVVLSVGRQGVRVRFKVLGEESYTLDVFDRMADRGTLMAGSTQGSSGIKGAIRKDAYRDRKRAPDVEHPEVTRLKHPRNTALDNVEQRLYDLVHLRDDKFKTAFYAVIADAVHAGYYTEFLNSYEPAKWVRRLHGSTPIRPVTPEPPMSVKDYDTGVQLIAAEGIVFNPTAASGRPVTITGSRAPYSVTLYSVPKSFRVSTEADLEKVVNEYVAKVARKLKPVDLRAQIPKTKAKAKAQEAKPRVGEKLRALYADILNNHKEFNTYKKYVLARHAKYPKAMKAAGEKLGEPFSTSLEQALARLESAEKRMAANTDQKLAGTLRVEVAAKKADVAVVKKLFNDAIIAMETTIAKMAPELSELDKITDKFNALLAEADPDDGRTMGTRDFPKMTASLGMLVKRITRAKVKLDKIIDTEGHMSEFLPAQRDAPDVSLSASSSKRPSAWVIVYDTSKSAVLVLKRSKTSNNPGLWNFPGGGLDNDGARKGAWRELYEEAGVKCDPRSLIKIGSMANRDATYYLLVLDETPRIKLDYAESSKHRWVTIKELRNYKKIHSKTAAFLAVKSFRKAVESLVMQTAIQD